MPFLGTQPAETALTGGQISDNVIDSDHYVDGSIDTAHIGANQIDGTLTKDALIADYSDVTITAADLIMYGDATDSNNTKRDTVQGILDLASGGSWTLIGTAVASGSANLTITGLDSTYDTYAIAVSAAVCADDTREAWLRVGDSGGIDSGASDYQWGIWSYITGGVANSGTMKNSTDNADAQIKLVDGTNLNNVGNASGEGCNVMAWINQPGDSAIWSMIHGTFTMVGNNGTDLDGYNFIGGRKAAITLTQVQFLFSAGSNITSGRMSVWGVKHA